MRWPRLRGLAAGFIALGLVVAGTVAAWIVITSGVLAAQPGRPDDGPERPRAATEALEATESAPLSASFQISQPRDPFRPLITEGSTTGDIPGIGGVPGGEEPADGDGFAPTATTITLKAIREVSGVLRATVVVGTVSYDVGVGDTFAVSYKVISLTTTKGVFTFGDSAFELSIGQQILK